MPACPTRHALAHGRAPGGRPPPRRAGRRAAAGLTLLEVLVALSILAGSLALIHRVFGSQARSVGELVARQRALLLAESLLASRESLGPEGWQEEGEDGPVRYAVRSQPEPPPPAAEVPRLHRVELRLEWTQGLRVQRLELWTRRPERRPDPGERR